MKRDYPESFRHIRLELAREAGHPIGDTEHGYDILAPLLNDGHIDGDLATENKDKCRVRRFRSGEEDAIGKLLRGPGGRWHIDYDDARSDDDEAGFRFDTECFSVGEYISIKEDDGEMHTFLVMSVSEL
jgi:hypothetical protein